jgi:hypothetical protein
MKHWILLTAILNVSMAFAGGTEPLDRAYGRLQSPASDLTFLRLNNEHLPPRSDVLWLMQHQSPVKAQQHRGTCSIFSATALLESMMAAAGKASPYIDLSEE